MNILKKIRRLIWSLKTWWKCIFVGLPYDKTWTINGKIIVCRPNRFHKPSIIQIGNFFHAQADIAWNTFGIIQPNVLNVRTPGAKLTIGNNVGISGSTISAQNSITIGNDVLIGSGCVICDSDSHPIHPNERNGTDNTTLTAPIVIDDKVFIGARSIILKGVHIGYGSVIGAGSVVTHNVEPMSIYAGNPAKFIRKI